MGCGCVKKSVEENSRRHLQPRCVVTMKTLGVRHEQRIRRRVPGDVSSADDLNIANGFESPHQLLLINHEFGTNFVETMGAVEKYFELG